MNIAHPMPSHPFFYAFLSPTLNPHHTTLHHTKSNHTALHLQMNAEDEGVLHFFDDQWQACPSSTDGSFLSPDEIVDKQVVVTFQIFAQGPVAKVYDREIGTGKSITMHYCPGRPYSILQVGSC